MLATAHVSIAESSPGQDDLLLEAALQALQASGYLLQRYVRCEVEDGVVVVSGVVPSFYLKQMVQSVLLNLRGVRAVQNEVEVIGG
jgi:osmotically-inducible protein OsmY